MIYVANLLWKTKKAWNGTKYQEAGHVTTDLINLMLDKREISSRNFTSITMESAIYLEAMELANVFSKLPCKHLFILL